MFVSVLRIFLCLPDPKIGTASRLTIERKYGRYLTSWKNLVVFGLETFRRDRELFREALKELNIGLERTVSKSILNIYLVGSQADFGHGSLS